MTDTNSALQAPWKLVMDSDHEHKFSLVPDENYSGERPQKAIVDEINRQASALVIDLHPKGFRAEKILQAQVLLLGKLRKLAEAVIDFPARSECAYFQKLGRHLGNYDEQYRDLTSPEIMILVPDDLNPRDLQFGPNTNDLKPEQQAVLVEIYRAKTVVADVFDRRQRSSKKRADEFQIVKAMYLRELRDIGTIASASPESSIFAQSRLKAFRDSFVTREAEIVKTQHLRLLGKYCLLFGIVPVITLGIAARYGGALGNQGWHALFLISLMAIGSTVGTWLSFSLRKIDLSYADLAGLEEDRLDPSGRVAFVMLLTIVFGMLIYSGSLSVSVDTTTFGFTTKTPPERQAIFALLIGAFSGIAERSLSGLVTKRAEEVFGLSKKRPSSRIIN